jgi:hypothetical protein
VGNHIRNAGWPYYSIISILVIIARGTAAHNRKLYNLWGFFFAAARNFRLLATKRYVITLLLLALGAYRLCVTRT